MGRSQTHLRLRDGFDSADDNHYPGDAAPYVPPATPTGLDIRVPYGRLSLDITGEEASDPGFLRATFPATPGFAGSGMSEWPATATFIATDTPADLTASLKAVVDTWPWVDSSTITALDDGSRLTITPAAGITAGPFAAELSLTAIPNPARICTVPNGTATELHFLGSITGLDPIVTTIYVGASGTGTVVLPVAWQSGAAATAAGTTAAIFNTFTHIDASATGAVATIAPASGYAPLKPITPGIYGFYLSASTSSLPASTVTITPVVLNAPANPPRIRASISLSVDGSPIADNLAIEVDLAGDFLQELVNASTARIAATAGSGGTVVLSLLDGGDTNFTACSLHIELAEAPLMVFGLSQPGGSVYSTVDVTVQPTVIFTHRLLRVTLKPEGSVSNVDEDVFDDFVTVTPGDEDAIAADIAAALNALSDWSASATNNVVTVTKTGGGNFSLAISEALHP